VKFTIRPLTPDLWPSLEDLFGRAGASNGCWCMYWRLGSAYRNRREQNKADLHAIVERGPPPGLLAFDGATAVGWCQITPRSALAYLDRARYTRAVDDSPVWAISCFYVRRGYRNRGVTTALIAAALKAAKRGNAPAVEAYPIDTRQPGASSNLYTGVASTFARAGFRTVAKPTQHRRIVRHDLKGVRK
jgi:GNAT superfamily N-acetyltransferase